MRIRYFTSCLPVISFLICFLCFVIYFIPITYTIQDNIKSLNKTPTAIRSPLIDYYDIMIFYLREIVLFAGCIPFISICLYFFIDTSYGVEDCLIISSLIVLLYIASLILNGLVRFTLSTQDVPPFYIQNVSYFGSSLGIPIYFIFITLECGFVLSNLLYFYILLIILRGILPILHIFTAHIPALKYFTLVIIHSAIYIFKEYELFGFEILDSDGENTCNFIIAFSALSCMLTLYWEKLISPEEAKGRHWLTGTLFVNNLPRIRASFYKNQEHMSVLKNLTASSIVMLDNASFCPYLSKITLTCVFCSLNIIF